MANWVIGDLHGCLDEFDRLTAQIGFDPDRDTLWLTGDLVNRGPRCLDTLRRIHALSLRMGDRLRVVLGNHDLHLLACWKGLRRPSANDTLGDILSADDANTLCEWLRRQPLMHREANHVLVHAGLYPNLSCEDNCALAHVLHSGLSGDAVVETLRKVYSRPVQRTPQPDDSTAQINFAAAALTRMRCLDADLSLNLAIKTGPWDLPAGVTPWFAHATRLFANLQIHTGHWAALGYGLYGPVVALDGACVWGGELVAVERENPAQPVRVARGDNAG
ncbi:MAG: symmetrical bis(5'-nucleosyl)-tetraphosphatase [Pseudomonadota bacterium]